ncbi:MAG: nucleoside hydrolase [Desulfobacterales bacterium]
MFVRKRLTPLLIVALLVSIPAVWAHDIQIPVIVDTDAAFDDIRALALLMNAGEVDIRVIVTSDGVLDPASGRKNMIRLLNYFNSQVEVVSGIAMQKEAPPFREINKKMMWPEVDDAIDDPPPDVSVVSAITETIENAGSQVLYICLGPMTNLAEALNSNPGIKDRIYRVLYLGGSPESESPGFNTERDEASAQIVFDSGMSIYSFGLEDCQFLPFDESWYHTISKADSSAARLIQTLHAGNAVQKKIAHQHMRIWDEMTIVGLFMPDAFSFAPDERFANSMRLTAYDAEAVKKTYLKLLGNPADFHLDARNSVVLKTFPMNPDDFRNDLAGHVKDIIRFHGEEEWKACMLTHEFHRHLGIYSIVGAKMGIRARELLEAPFDTLTVVSHAGLKPPLSCLNDGLQVSTGASLGRGAIRVTENRPEPEAVFIHGSSRQTLRLKKAYGDRIRSDIEAALERFGGLSPAYFEHIRTLSIRYWKEFDRCEMFEEALQ